MIAEAAKSIWSNPNPLYPWLFDSLLHYTGFLCLVDDLGEFGLRRRRSSFRKRHRVPLGCERPRYNLCPGERIGDPLDVASVRRPHICFATT